MFSSSSASSLRVLPGGVEFQQVWQQARAGCEQILNWPTSRLRGDEWNAHVMDNYTLVYRLASNPGRNVPGLVKGGSEHVSGKDEQSTQVLVLYYLLREMLKSHLETKVKPNFLGKADVDILRTYEEQWKKFIVALDLLSVVFRYLHNHWSKQGLPAGHATTSTKPLGLMLWGDIIVTTLRGPLENELLACVRADRERGIVDQRSTELVRSILSTFTALCAYDNRRHFQLADVFENPYTRDTMAYYMAAAQQSLQGNDLAQYVHDATQWTREEMRRVERYTSEKSTIPTNISRTLLTCFVETKTDYLFASIDDLLIQQDERNTRLLSDLFQLIRPSESTVQRFAEKLKLRVVEDGLKSIATQAPREHQGAEFMQIVLDMHRKYKMLIHKHLDKHQALRTALRQGCREFINHNPQHRSELCAEHFARHVHGVLRPSQTRDDDMEPAIRELVEVFDLFDERDVFQASYSQLLCQRLIHGNYREEWEDRCIAAFRLECGRDFTYKWERMLADSTVNRRELKEKYYADLAVCPSPCTQTELNPLILTSAWWPLKLDSSPYAPSGAVTQLQRHFEQFYAKVIGGRHLRWLAQFSNGVVEARLAAAAPLTFTVSALQWELLQLFNASPRSATVSFASFKSATQSTDIAALQRAAFAFLKAKLFSLQDSGERDVEKHVYVLNTEFTSSQRRINFLQLAGTESAQRLPVGLGGEETSTTPTSVVPTVQHERRFAIQAAIVRVMKSRKTATYSEILSDVEGILRKNSFVVSPQDLKANLEVLIEKEYVERSPSDPNSFVYLT